MTFEQEQALNQVLLRREKLARLLQLYPDLDPENVWHTLILLEKTPRERLELGIMRGKKPFPIHRS